MEQSPQQGWFINFRQAVKNKLQEAYQNVSMAAASRYIASGAYHMGTYTLEQIKAVPETVKSFVTHPRSKRVISHLGRIVAEDIVPMVALNTANDWLQTYAVTDESDNPEPVNYNFLLQAGLLMVNTGVWLYTKRKQVQVATRTAILLTDYPKAFAEATFDRKKDSEVCNECNQKRYIKGEIRALMVYMTQVLALKGIEQTPIIGPSLVIPLEWLLNGQLFMDYRLANDGLCERHRAEFFKEHPSLSLSLGISHDLAVRLPIYALQKLTGLPLESAISPLKSLAIIPFTALTHHMQLPKAVQQSNNLMFDPLSLIRWSIALGIDISLPGLKKQLKRLLSARGEPLPLEAYIKLFIDFYTNPKTQRISIFFLPRMLLSSKAFMNDAVVGDYGPELIDSMAELIEVLEAYRNVTLTDAAGAFFQGQIRQAGMNLFLAAGAVHPKLIAKLSQSLGGPPKEVVKLVIGLLNDQSFMNQLSDFKLRLKHFGKKQDVLLIKKVREGIRVYIRERNGGTPGIARAQAYELLFEKIESDAAKYLLCVALLKNTASTRLRKGVLTNLGLNKIIPFHEDKVDALVERYERKIIDSFVKAPSPITKQRILEKCNRLIKTVNEYANGEPKSVDVIAHALQKWESDCIKSSMSEDKLRLIKNTAAQQFFTASAPKNREINFELWLANLTKGLNAYADSYHSKGREGEARVRVFLNLLESQQETLAQAFIGVAILSNSKGPTLKTMVLNALKLSEAARPLELVRIKESIILKLAPRAGAVAKQRLADKIKRLEASIHHLANHSFQQWV